MSDYRIIHEMASSTLYRTKSAIEEESYETLRLRAYMLIVALRCALSQPSTRAEAQEFLDATLMGQNFNYWRPGGSDLYMVLHGLTMGKYAEAKEIGELHDAFPFIRWLRAVNQDPDDIRKTQRFFLQLDKLLDINKASYKAVRRLAQDWPTSSVGDKQLVCTRLLQIFRAHMPRSRMTRILQRMGKEGFELHDVCDVETGQNCDGDDVPQEKSRRSGWGVLAGVAAFATGYSLARRKTGVRENATAGATSAASVASVVGGLDPNGHRGIYEPSTPKKRKRKAPRSNIIRRDPDQKV
jgi:hypothetical protein